MTQSIRERIRSVPHEVNRLAVAVGEPLESFRARYEQAVPVFDAERFERLIAEGADWDAVLEATKENAPHGFIIYWSHDFSPLLRLAGHGLRCVEYLMGNHEVAETMYRHNPAILLYAPLRTAIYEDAVGDTWFTVDQPRTRFSSFGDPGITQGGVELDRRLAALLDHLRVPVPDILTAPA
ncbi:DUF302 domain-containing protein [Microtetraspora sp. NBRC 16547]|uniref:DUF302 domain-containing protein n=1 Tax=Microtetraspora sp. NBRC 16547 TaxID=3030993 RepID=UPI0024A1F9C7|nr:DUF302 domain-containing protein [Microtetraspora sp. NBRC 16547]GLX01863.1 hypothetical protein Misp02_59490 [Microtetraspora sp. NBRC 16547]